MFFLNWIRHFDAPKISPEAQRAALLRFLQAPPYPVPQRKPREAHPQPRARERPVRRPRDSQRSRVYRAEHGLPGGTAFPALQDCRAYVDGVTASAWWRSRYPALPAVEVRDGRGSSRARASTTVARISLPRGCRSQLVIFHELAHLATPRTFAAHGPEFASRYLEMVEHFMGAAPADALHRRFIEHRVRVGGVR